MKIIIFISLSFVSWFIITMIIDVVLMGSLHFRYYKKSSSNVLIKKKNRIDFQQDLTCSAFSCAYLLRHFGIEANGVDLYSLMPNKMKNGYVYQKGISKLLLNYGIATNYCRGNINTLRHELQKGNPVIVLIRYNTNKNWLHYVPVVGIDDENVYIAESLEELSNCHGNNYYNRTIPINEFKKLWNTRMIKMPCYKNTYFNLLGKSKEEK